MAAILFGETLQSLCIDCLVLHRRFQANRAKNVSAKAHTSTNTDLLTFSEPRDRKHASLFTGLTWNDVSNCTLRDLMPQIRDEFRSQMSSSSSKSSASSSSSGKDSSLAPPDGLSGGGDLAPPGGTRGDTSGGYVRNETTVFSRRRYQFITLAVFNICHWDLKEFE